MDNRQLSDIFILIANLSEIKGEIIYKTLAYRKAAESLLSLGRDVNEIWKEGKLEEIPGVGKAISEKIDELLRTGKLEFLEKLEKEVPPCPGRLAAGARPGSQEGRPDLEGTRHYHAARTGKRRPGRKIARPARHGREIRGAGAGRASNRWRAAPGGCRSAWPTRSCRASSPL